MEEIIGILEEVRPECDFRISRDYVGDGLLDSFDIVALVAALEDRYSILIDALDILPENFSSVEAIAALVAKSGGTL